MSNQVDSSFLLELQEYGAVGAEICFNCGTCTAQCPLASDGHTYPRNMIRLAQLGLRDQIRGNVDPWLCYYCGDCSESCPREAEPAETMMALRRWLTAQYSGSEHSAQLYTSEKAVWKTIIRAAFVPLILILLYQVLTGFDNIVTDQVELNTFAPVMIFWAFVLLHGVYLGYRMIRGSLNMSKDILAPVTSDAKIPLRVYLEEFKLFVVNLLTQKRWRDCGEDRSNWLMHLLLVIGYVTMLVLIMGFLWWFQTDNIYPITNPQRWVGYIATILLIVTSSSALVGRWKKNNQMHRFSQPTDWLFPIFILVAAVTGIMINIFRYAGWPVATYSIYTIHVMACIAMLDVEVGIGKWAHLFYRPLAIYLDGIRTRVSEEQVAPGLAPAGGTD
jgi:ferredoxin/energy-converting hydrogenase Eha subunit A